MWIALLSLGLAIPVPAEPADTSEATEAPMPATDGQAEPVEPEEPGREYIATVVINRVTHNTHKVARTGRCRKIEVSGCRADINRKTIHSTRAGNI